MKNLKYFLLWTLIIAVHTSIYSQFPFESYYLDDNHSTLRSSSLVNFDSRNGYDFPTKGVYRALTIAVNIIYDQTPSADPVPQITNTAWDYTSAEGININPPSYLLQLMDVNNVQPFNGCLTRLFAESSFNQLVLLSDYMVVNIKQSTITPNNSGANFSYIQLMNSVASYINNNGGLNTLYNHNSIFDFDFCTLSSSGVEKSITPDYKIDIINFILRNTRKEYGSITQGQGYAGINVKPTTLLKINNSYYGYNIGTYQCLGNGDYTPWKKFALTHEYAHFFLGNNAFHTSGGNHVGSNETNTFIGIQYGYGLFNGGLLSCNGYERWRLGWQSNTNNMYPIASNNVNSDIIAPFEGERTFLLRDFVSYGDAIRIKLPYKDRESASNQYIWLENHQCGKNGKLDEPIYNIAGSCRNVVRAGIYAYYQVGKDVLEGNIYSNVYPYNESDNLKMISAEGNYNVSYLNNEEDCIGGVDLYLRSYSNQTENIDKLIEELEKTEHADRLAALGLTSVFDELVAAQQAFKSIYLEQSEANASLRVTPSASSLRKRLENSIRNYLQFVHAMKDVDGWSLLYAELNELAKAARNSKQSRASTPAL